MIGAEIPLGLGATNVGTTSGMEFRIIIFLEPAQRSSSRMTSSSFRSCSPVEKMKAHLSHGNLTTLKFATWGSHLATHPGIIQKAAYGNGATDGMTETRRGNGNRVVRYEKYIYQYISICKMHISIYINICQYIFLIYIEQPNLDTSRWKERGSTDRLASAGEAWWLLITFLDIVGWSFFLVVVDNFTRWWLIKFLDIVGWSLF